MSDVTFSVEERARLAKACQALGIKFPEFVKWATLQALDECEGLAREMKGVSMDSRRSA